MKVSINDGSDWKTFSVLLKPSQRLTKKKQKNMKLVGGRSFPLKENPYFPGCNGGQISARWLCGVADKRELLWLLFDFFGQTLHASGKQKSCFVMFSL